MPLYDAFNLCEAAIWGIVAAVIDVHAPAADRRQGTAVTIAALAFCVFGLTDVLEVGTRGFLPIWLWGLKVACGGAILVARTQWRGWATFRWRDREVLLALGCLGGVSAILLVQWT